MSSREDWRFIPNYENHYMVSNLGRVKSVNRVIVRSNGACQTVKEKILKPQKSDYLNIKLRNKQGSKVHYIHALVAVSFLNHKPNGHKGKVVDHIDCNKHNNNVSNLRLISHRMNIMRGMKNRKQHEQ